MALTLLALHVKSYTTSPSIRSTNPECFTFTTTEKRAFLCTLHDASHPLVQEVILFEEQWSIYSYDKKLLRVAGRAIAEGKVDAIMTYEMKLANGKGLNPQLDEELQAVGIDIVEDKEWFVKTYPEQANMVEVEQTWVARSRTDLEVFGYVQVLSTPSDIYIGQVRVLPAHQSKGIAKKLLSFVHGIERYKPIWLHVFGDNLPAIGLYLSLGYRVDKVAWRLSKAKVPVEGVVSRDGGPAIASVAS